MLDSIEHYKSQQLERLRENYAQQVRLYLLVYMNIAEEEKNQNYLLTHMPHVLFQKLFVKFP